MARVLVTGANGFIGTHLTESLLARGDEVTCMVRRTSQAEHLRALGARLVYGDVTDPDSLRAVLPGAQTVYHLAGCVMALDREKFYQVNCGGTANVARVCAEQTSPPVMVYVSSLAAAGPAPDGRLRTEADQPAPVSEYGRSKRAAEMAAQQFAADVPITVVRPPIVFGPWDRVGLSMFRPIARFGVHLTPGLARSRFSLIHAADLAQLLILAAERGKRMKAPGINGKPAPCGVYFAAAESHPTYAELGRMIGAVSGRARVAVIPVATPLVWLIASGAEVVSQVIRQPYILNYDKAWEMTAGSWTCSPHAAMEDMAFSVGAPLVERLRQTVEWYRAHEWM